MPIFCLSRKYCKGYHCSMLRLYRRVDIWKFQEKTVFSRGPEPSCNHQRCTVSLLHILNVTSLRNCNIVQWQCSIDNSILCYAISFFAPLHSASSSVRPSHMDTWRSRTFHFIIHRVNRNIKVPVLFPFHCSMQPLHSPTNFKLPQQ